MKLILSVPIVFALLVIMFLIVTRPDANQQSAGTQTTPRTSPEAVSNSYEYAESTEIVVPEGKEIATFAGGCFWCVEAVFQETNGIDNVISGFAGGTEVMPSYEDVASGLTSHREAIQFTYDPLIISYDEILDILWQSIDPTDGGGQFVDRGYVYTTAIYYHDTVQKQLAMASMNSLVQERGYSEQLATKLVPFTTFYPAEEYHQDYYKKASENYKRYESGSGRDEYRETLD